MQPKKFNACYQHLFVAPHKKERKNRIFTFRVLGLPRCGWAFEKPSSRLASPAAAGRSPGILPSPLVAWSYPTTLAQYCPSSRQNQRDTFDQLQHISTWYYPFLVKFKRGEREREIFSCLRRSHRSKSTTSMDQSSTEIMKRCSTAWPCLHSCPHHATSIVKRSGLGLLSILGLFATWACSLPCWIS